MRAMKTAYGWARGRGRGRAAIPIGLASLALACAGGTTPPPDVPPNPAELLATPNAPATPAPAPAGDDVTKGARALEANDATAAKAYFDHALKSNPNNADALYYEGVLAEKAGDKDGAEKDYKAALKAKPDHEQ